jgi:hypothetical protein
MIMFEGLSLGDMFELADEVGDKYLSPEEIEARDLALTEAEA